jgi:hypothetical protein
LSNKLASFTSYTAEEEVLLLPLFTFQVTDVYLSSTKHEIKRKDGSTFHSKVIEVTLAEIPHMDLL